MNTLDPQKHDEPTDRAMASRLARLRTMPVDTSRLEKSLHLKIPQASATWGYRILRIRPLRAAAASVALLAILAAILLATASGPALASPAQMARMHQDIVLGRTAVMQVDSIAEANRALSAQSPRSPRLPSIPADHVMACCMKSVKNKRVACVLLKEEGIPVTLTVANASDMRTPASPVTLRDGVAYHVQSFTLNSGTLNMVMTERNGRWICLIGQTQAGRLMELASKLSF